MEQGQERENGLSFREPHISNLSAGTSVPADRRSSELLRRLVEEQEAELERLHEPYVRKLGR